MVTASLYREKVIGLLIIQLESPNVRGGLD